ncbi:MAG: prepilin-type N-terminal cleavage/methylation domain-containing protein [Nitrospiraceae bacterium]
MRLDEAGFTLIEGMLAAVVLAIGLLALSGMQAISLGTNVDANELTRATTLASDMIERIQFNRFNVAAYHGIDTAASTPCAQSATAQPMARGDCLQWQTMLNNSGLTGMTGTVVLAPIPPATDPLNLNRTTVQVSVRWTGGMATSTGQGLGKLSRPKTVTMTTVVARE